ncbi:MAG: GAF domain-containing protein [Anaerolineales bacterium]|nr:GAF domain-containing protein [Anaerolineales bacterium]
MDEVIRILIVEDLPTDAKLAERQISKELNSCEFRVVDNREDYLSALHTFHPDIIISDYRLPQFDGLSALNLALEHAPLTPLIVLTGSLNEDTAVSCMKAGASDYVIKEHIKRLGPAVLHALDEKQVRKERRKAEIALRESEERFRTLYENATIGLYRSTPDGDVLMANPAVVRILGFDSFEEISRLNIEKDHFGPQYDRAEIKRILEEEGAFEGMESPWLKKDGTTIYVRENAKAVRDESGKIIYYDGVIEDITAARLADERIRHEAARAETLVRTAARLNASLDLQQALTAVCEETAKALDVPIVNIFLYDPEDEEFTSAMALGMPKEEYLNLPKFPYSVVKPFIESRSLLILADSGEIVKQLNVTGFVPRDYRSLAVAFIQFGEQIIGALSVASIGEVREYTPDDQALLTGIADQAAMAISNARLFTQQKQAEALYRSRSEELEALFSLSAHLREAQTTESMTSVMLSEMRRVINSDGGAILLLDNEKQIFTVTQAEGNFLSELGKSFPSNEGGSGQVLRSRQPFITPDYSSMPFKASGLVNIANSGPMAIVPLQSENEFLGVFIASRENAPHTQPFTDGDVRLLSAMAEMAGTALRRAWLFDDVQRHLRHTQALHDIQLTVASSFDLKVTLNVFLEHTLTQLEVDAASVFLLDPHTLTLEYAAGRGFRTYNLDRSRRRLDDNYALRAALERKMISIPNIDEDASDFSHTPFIIDEGFVSYFGIPFIAKGQVKGVLEVYTRTPLHPNIEWMSFLETLAGQVAIAIDNLALFKDLHSSNTQLTLAYDATIQGLSRALDLRDKETEGHTQRVADMTLRLARAFGMMDNELVHVRRGALLHDMGKMGIPDSILLKPGPLTEEEWEIMRLHPVYAYEMFSPIEYLRPALDIPYYHHEKWDGTGYPEGLKGDEIPLAARLFAVVDVWDALTSERPYRPAWSNEKALDYIREQSGKHFDPRAVDMFFAILQLQNEIV